MPVVMKGNIDFLLQTDHFNIDFVSSHTVSDSPDSKTPSDICLPFL